MISLQQAMEQFAFFQALDPEFREQFLREVKLVELPAAYLVCAEQDYCTSLSLLVQGSVRVYKASDTGREITLYRIAPGESCVLTASCILSNIRFPAFAVTEQPCLAVVVPLERVRAWMNNPVWQGFVFSLVSHRLADVIELVEEIAFCHLDKRVAALLLALGGGADSKMITTHQKIADELGSSREVVSRILKDMEHHRLITLGRGSITLLDKAGLQKIAQGDLS